MNDAMKQQIQKLLDQHRTLRIATPRPDGWPQVMTVGYANEGFTICFLCGTDSQKAANLDRDDRVSLAIDDDPAEVMEITGISMAARAKPVTDRTEAEKAIALLMARYPEQKASGLPTHAVGGSPVSPYADGNLAARLFEGVWTHRSRDVLSAHCDR